MSEQRWIIEEREVRIGSFRPVYITDILIPMLERWVRLFVPALFSRIEIMSDRVIVEVPYQVAPRFVRHLRRYRYDVHLEVIGV